MSTHRAHEIPSGRGMSIWLGIALILFALSLFTQLYHMLDWYQRGGSPWAQGDWLINLASGPIRRGPFGSALLWMSGASGIPILDLLIGLQLVLTLALYGLAASLLVRQPDHSAVLAVFSAAFFVLLIGSAPLSGLRKEMLGFIALLLIACPGGGRGRLVLSSGLLAACSIGHEVGVLFTPAWLTGLWLLRSAEMRRWPERLLAGCTALIGLGAGLYAIRFSLLADAEPVCAAIHAAGPVSDEICSGAIEWLTYDDGGMTRVIEVIQIMGTELALALLAMGLAVVPLIVLLWLCRAPRRLVLALALAVAPFFLLYPVGFDWGRWLSIQYTVAVFLTLGLMQRGLLSPVVPPSRVQMGLWLGVALATGLNLSVNPIPFSFPLMVYFVLARLL